VGNSRRENTQNQTWQRSCGQAADSGSEVLSDARADAPDYCQTIGALVPDRARKMICRVEVTLFVCLNQQLVHEHNIRFW
jgi:hypothetical protein